MNLTVRSFSRAAAPADLGRRVRTARTSRRWSQVRLAERAGVSRASVMRAEGANAAATRPDTLMRIAHALGLDARTFVPGWPEWEPLAGGVHGPAARERRRILGLTLAQVASSAGVSEATLSRHERGIGTSPSLVRMAGEEPFAGSDRLARSLGFQDARALDDHVRGRRRDAT